LVTTVSGELGAIAVITVGLSSCSACSSVSAWACGIKSAPHRTANTGVLPKRVSAENLDMKNSIYQS